VSQHNNLSDAPTSLLALPLANPVGQPRKKTEEKKATATLSHSPKLQLADPYDADPRKQGVARRQGIH
jgi:hypothetical protein